VPESPVVSRETEDVTWKSIATAPEGVALMTRIDDANGLRNESILTRVGHLFFSGSMRVYYEPTHWRLTTIEQLRIKNEAEAKAIRQLELASKAFGRGAR